MPVPDLQALLPYLPQAIAATGVTVAGRKAIARLVAGMTDLAMIPVDGWLQAAKDQREERTTIRKAVTDAAAKVAAGDEALVRRALAAQFSRAAQEQLNREAVAVAALEVLAEPKASEGPTSQAHSSESAEDVDDDWLNVFARHAENATSERMRRLWGRVLAGEILKPGTYSQAALRVLAEMPSGTAQLFEKFGMMALGVTVFPEDRFEPADLMELTSAGVLSSGTEPVEFGLGVQRWDEEDEVLISGVNYAVIGKLNKGLTFSVARLSRAGAELLELLPNRDERQAALRIGQRIAQGRTPPRPSRSGLPREHARAAIARFAGTGVIWLADRSGGDWTRLEEIELAPSTSPALGLPT